MDVTPIEEAGHHGYLVGHDGRVVVVDPPLDDALVRRVCAVTAIAAVVETGPSTGRVLGGRVLAGALGVPLLAAPGVVRQAHPLRPGDAVPGWEGVTVAAGAGGIVLATPAAVFVGTLDAAEWVAGEPAARAVDDARRRLATAYPDAVAYGSAGIGPAAGLPHRPPPSTGPGPLNLDAVEVTNRGDADLFWADPRFVAEAPPIGVPHLRSRLGSPWAPTVVDLRTAGEPVEGSRRLSAASLATRLDSLAGERELVVLADDAALGRRAAGFLVRLGFRAAWADPEAATAAPGPPR